MKKIRIFMIDNNKKVVEEVRKYFSSNAVIEVIDTAIDGGQALEIIKNNYLKYDLIIMELVISNVDGLSILEELGRLGINFKCIVTTSINSTKVIKRSIEQGANYYILKPYKLEILEHYIKLICCNDVTILNDKELINNITRLLHLLGIPSNIKGYIYIRDSINIIYNNPNSKYALTKDVYPMIAKYYDTTSINVERAIRHAIDISWIKGDYNLIENLFGNSISYEKSKPTNAEFILTLADNLRLDKVII